MMSTPSQPHRFAATPINPAKYNDQYEVGRTQLLETLIPSGSGRALDVGCGSGHFTAKLKNKGWQITAVDTDPTNVERAAVHADQAKLGDAISVLSDLEPGSYDLACAFEIIEHMDRSDGEALVDMLHSVLRRDGLLLLSTPNRLSPEGVTGQVGEKVLKWRKWNAWDPTHVHIYSSFEIARLCRGHGFEIEAVTGYWYNTMLPVAGVDLSLPWRSFSRFPLSHLGFNTIVQARKR